MLPLTEYTGRQDRWRAERLQQQQLLIRIGNLRLLTALAAAFIAWFAFERGAMTAWWLLVPAIVFLALAVWHQTVIRRRTLAERALRFYEQGLARLKDLWAGAGATGDVYRDGNHIYSEDLDLFGKGSLFEFISNARTAAGEQALAGWLLTTASLTTAMERQAAVRELSAKLDLREEIVLLGDDIRSNAKTATLQQWGNAPPIAFPGHFRLLAFLLASVGLVVLILKLAEILPLWSLLVVLACDFAVIFFTRRQVAQITAPVETAAHDLELLSALIERLEREQFSCSYLRRLHSQLQTDGPSAARRIRSLQRWMELLDSSDHVLMRIAGPLVLWKQQITAALEAWRRENGARVGEWVQALAEIEALSSLATLAFERPSWAFPQFASAETAAFDAKGLRHPLLATSLSIANDVSVGGVRRLLIVSGSNMSGKSTLLRAVGLNTVLAWCGAPVAADALRISPVKMGASIRVTDSLQDNRSRFFAEISRLRQIVELTKSGQRVLFLLDELLSGTNSHDRRIGASGVLRGLLNANSIGLMTTHDLALTQLDEELEARSSNVHFEDRITNGTVEFDYRLLPGIVTHSNALELMRSIGLEI